MTMISQRAMVARVNRKLAMDGHTRLRTFRPNSKWFNQYGPFYIVNKDNVIEAHGIDDLNKLATELGITAVTC